MLARTTILLTSSVLLFACGTVADDSGVPVRGGGPDAGGSTGPEAHSPSYGEVFAQVTTSMTVNGGPAYEVGAKLRAPAPASSADDACNGAAKKIGACCYLPPSPPSSASGSHAGESSDGGSTNVDESAGKIAFSAGASDKPIATIDFGRLPSGFGQGLGYPTSLINPTTWGPGDLLEVEALGAEGQVPAFALSVRAVDLPNAVTPSAISRAATLALSWKPDANATTMTLKLSSFANSTSHGGIVCTVADAAGGVSVDPSLFASFVSNDKCWGSLERSTSTSIEIAGGHVSFVAKAQQTFRVPVE